MLSLKAEKVIEYEFNPPQVSVCGCRNFYQILVFGTEGICSKKANQELSSIPSLYIYTVYIRSVIEFLE